MNKEYSDKDLFKKFGIDNNEIKFIEEKVKEMVLDKFMSSERELYFDKLGIPRIYCYTTPEFENVARSSDSSKKGLIKVGYTLKQFKRRE